MTNTTIAAGTWVKTISGHVGQVCYSTADGWYGVGIEGEKTVTGNQRTDEWPRSALTVLEGLN